MYGYVTGVSDGWGPKEPLESETLIGQRARDQKAL